MSAARMMETVRWGKSKPYRAIVHLNYVILPREKPTTFKSLVGVIIIGGVIIAWLVWSLFGLNVTESHGVITAAKAESITGLKLPSEAMNIRTARYSQWVNYAEFVRFEAPVNVCLRCALKITPRQAMKPTDEYDLKYAAGAGRSAAFSDFTWFDLY